jgi:hypothetical protein
MGPSIGLRFLFYYICLPFLSSSKLEVGERILNCLRLVPNVFSPTSTHDGHVVGAIGNLYNKVSMKMTKMLICDLLCCQSGSIAESIVVDRGLCYPCIPETLVIASSNRQVSNHHLPSRTRLAIAAMLPTKHTTNPQPKILRAPLHPYSQILDVINLLTD